MAIKDMLKSLDNETDLLFDLDRFLESKDNSRPPDGMFHPSNASSCPRSIYYYLSGVKPEPFNAETVRRLDNGTKVHERIEGYFEDMGIVVAREKKIKYTIKSPAPSIVVTGNCDEIINYDGEELILEIKSCNSFMYTKFVKLGVDQSHYTQWNLYSYGYKKKNGIILYENQDTKKMKPYKVSFSQVLFDETINKFKKVQKALDNKLIPRRPYKGMSDKACLYCRYKDHCWEKR